jgi:hypothetical protein
MGKSGGSACRAGRGGEGRGVMARVEEYAERKLELAGWDVQLTTYRLGEVYHCKADNVSPGAALARTSGTTREEAESKAIERAQKLLNRTRRQSG